MSASSETHSATAVSAKGEKQRTRSAGVPLFHLDHIYIYIHIYIACPREMVFGTGGMGVDFILLPLGAMLPTKIRRRARVAVFDMRSIYGRGFR